MKDLETSRNAWPRGRSVDVSARAGAPWSAAAATALPVHRATPADLPTMNRVVKAAVAGWALPERVRRLSLPVLCYDETDLEYMEAGLTADRDGTAIGAVVHTRADSCDAPPGRSAQLLHGVYVVPTAQRVGVGTRLVAHACQAARARSLDGVSVRAWRGAEAFFTSLGFAPYAGDEALYPRRLWRVL